MWTRRTATSIDAAGTGSSAVDDNGLMPIRQRRRVVGGVAAAAAFEWYEFYCFGIAAALVLGPQFFSAGSGIGGLVASFATLGAGFLTRPIGGVLAGIWGDRIGRKPVLLTSLVVISLVTACIGLLPPYAAIGVAAPVVLVILRLVQGLAVGAMWAGAVLLTTEHAPEDRRGLYGSLVSLGPGLGLIVANVVFAASAALMSGPAFDAVGWRIPFVLGLLALPLAWYLSRVVEETPEFVAAKRDEDATKAGGALGEVLRHHKLTVLLVILAILAGPVFTYVLSITMLDYTTRVLGISRATMLTLQTLGGVIPILLVPIFAMVSDRFGRYRVYGTAVVLIGLWAVPMCLLIETSSVLLIVVSVLVASVLGALIAGPQAVIVARAFITEVRYTGSSFAYQISATIAGSLTPLAAVALIAGAGDTLWGVAALLVVTCVLSVAATLVLARRNNLSS